MDENAQSDKHLGIFEEDHINALDVFGKACEDEGLNTAIAIVEHPNTGKPMVFVRGHLYDIGVIMTHVTANIRAELLKDLNVK